MIVRVGVEAFLSTASIAKMAFIFGLDKLDRGQLVMT